MSTLKYKRVLLKLSGEAFSGETGYGIDTSTLTRIAKQIKQVMEMGGDIANLLTLIFSPTLAIVSLIIS